EVLWTSWCAGCAVPRLDLPAFWPAVRSDGATFPPLRIRFCTAGHQPHLSLGQRQYVRNAFANTSAPDPRLSESSLLAGRIVALSVSQSFESRHLPRFPALSEPSPERAQEARNWPPNAGRSLFLDARERIPADERRVYPKLMAVLSAPRPSVKSW